jgi:hypothetical protein
MRHLGETVSLWSGVVQRLSERLRVDLWDQWEAGGPQH